MKKAIIILSGGLDSAVSCAIAKSMNFEIYALSFDYGQRHKIEIDYAKKLAKFFAVKEHKIAKIDLRIFGNSALTDDIEVPKKQSETKFSEKSGSTSSIPITYVPARNTIFLSYSLAYAEIIAAFDIFIGINAIDYSGYPDCRPNYIEAFEKMANLATVANIRNSKKNGAGFKIQTPLLHMSKSEIVKTGKNLGVDFSLTHSCYDPITEKDGVISCAECDSCRFRLGGFAGAGLEDPIRYRK